MRAGIGRSALPRSLHLLFKPVMAQIPAGAGRGAPAPPLIRAGPPPHYAPAHEGAVFMAKTVRGKKIFLPFNYLCSFTQCLTSDKLLFLSCCFFPPLFYVFISFILSPTMFQQTFKNFNINLNVSNERGTFSSGDQTAGHVSFDLTKRTKITSVTMKLSGRAKVAWTTRRTRGNRSNNWAKLDLFDIKGVIMQDNSCIDAAGA